MDIEQLKQKARELLEGTLRHTRKAALAAALVPFGAVPASASIITYSSRVDAIVTQTPSGTYLYEFTVVNTTPGGDLEEFRPAQPGIPVIIDWELPLFSQTDIFANTVQSPPGWNFEIVTPFNQPPSFWNYNAATDPLLQTDPNLYGPNPQVFNEPPFVLHWFTSAVEGNPIYPGGRLSGFSFESAFNQSNAPYLTSWEELPPIGGDPPIPNQAFGTPNSPARQSAQGTIPEPSTLALFALGAAALLGGNLVRRRKGNSNGPLPVES